MYEARNGDLQEDLRADGCSVQVDDKKQCLQLSKETFMRLTAAPDRLYKSIELSKLHGPIV
jgi:hypothetical protein